MTYNPLPPFLQIEKSAIDGYGLITLKDLCPHEVLGITHVVDDRFEDGYIRTPLGGFFNHSDDPNCEAYVETDLIKLRTIRNISAGEELTAFYWLYDLE
jgi:SET domain-containing protein